MQGTGHPNKNLFFIPSRSKYLEKNIFASLRLLTEVNQTAAAWSRSLFYI